MKKLLLFFFITIIDYLYPLDTEISQCWIPALIAGLASIGSAIYAGVKNNKAIKKANAQQLAYNKELATFQQGLNTQNYLQYSTPKQIMAQYKEAGLNPNLIYNNANPSAPAVAQVDGVNLTPQNYDYMKNAANGVANAVSQYYSNLFKDRKLDIDQQNADIKEAESASRIRLNDLNSTGVGIKNKYLEEYWQGTLAGIKLKNVHQDTVNKIANYNLTTDLIIETAKKRQELENLKKQGLLSDKQLRVMEQNIRVMETVAAYNQARTRQVSLENQYSFEANPYRLRMLGYDADMKRIDRDDYEFKSQWQNNYIYWSTQNQARRAAGRRFRAGVGGNFPKLGRLGFDLFVDDE